MCKITDIQEEDRYSRKDIAALHLLTGARVNPFDYFLEPCGLDKYLRTTGIHSFSFEEQQGPLPYHRAWPSGAVPLAILQQCRDLIKEPIDWRWWYRPEELNERVGGEPDSDHIYACAVDVDFRSAQGIQRSLEEVIRPLYRTGLFAMSVGIGARRLHLGCFSPRGQRQWYYESRLNEKLPKGTERW